MVNEKKVIINLILDSKTGETNTDFDKFLELKDIMGNTKPNTEILRASIRLTHKLLFG